MTNYRQKVQLGKRLDQVMIGETATGTMKITEDTIELYAKITGDRNPLHFDKEYTKKTIFGRPIAHGPIAGGLVARIIGMQLPGLGTLAYNMKVNFKAPVYPGDEITAIIEAKEKIPEKNILRLTFKVMNQDNIEVLDGYANVMPPL